MCMVVIILSSSVETIETVEPTFGRSVLPVAEPEMPSNVENMENKQYVICASSEDQECLNYPPYSRESY